MALAGTGLVLGTALCLAGLVVDPLGITKTGQVATALCLWIVTNAVVTNIPPDGTLSGAGAVITGSGRITFSASGNDLGDHLAAAVPAVDPGGIAKWRVLGNALVTHITTQGRADGSTMVGPGFVGGAVTGNGTLSFASSVFAPTLAADLGLVDAANQVTWLALGGAILAHLSANAIIGVVGGGPTGFIEPTGGGILTGASLIG